MLTWTAQTVVIVQSLQYSSPETREFRMVSKEMKVL